MAGKTYLSIVVPVYNAEKYLPECMDSLLSTSGIEKTEILLIDDGSTDGSGKIADSCAKSTGTYREDADATAAERPVIRVIHKENEGPSATRNLGMKEARGEYIFFCDADDMVEPVLFEKIISMSETSEDDMFLWDSEIVYDLKDLMAHKDPEYFAHYGLPKVEKTYSGKEIMEILIREGKGFIATVWLSAYRRDFLLSNELFFETGLIYEDELWVPKVLLKAKSVHYIPEKIYRYRVRPGSITNPDKKDLRKNVEALYYVYTSLYKYYDEVLAGDPLLGPVEGNLTKRYLHMIYKLRFWKYGYGKKIDKKKLWKTSRRLRDKVLVLGLYVIAH
ncbi:MAG: glycosyltransferase [Clostridiales bacterium]|nr:glycosyltransferase [Clostridiales bacterium]